jgi:multiple sugar transport system substrate-binding protein
MKQLPGQLLVPLAATGLLLAAILTGERPTRDARGRPTVVYAHPPCPPDLMAYFTRAFDDFRRTHPDLDFRVLHVTGNYEDKIKVMFAGNVAPDVIFMYPTALPAWVQLGALRPLNDWMGSHSADYFPAALETFSYRGMTYGLPKDASADLLFYNPTLFQRHGLQPPTSDWTWQDMLRAAKAITEDRDGDGRTDVYGIQQPDWQLLVRQNGGRVLSEDGTRCLLDSPEAIEALEFWAALRQLHKVVPTPELMMDLSIWRMFALQRTGMLVSVYPAVPILRQSCDFEWDIAPLPRGPKRAYATFSGSALAVTSRSRHPEAAFAWARWMTTEGMRHVMTFDIPAYIKLGASDEWRDATQPPPSKQVAVDAMAMAGPPMQHPAYAEILDAIGPQLDRANRGLVSVRDAVRAVVPKVNAILARSEAP